MTYCLGFLLQSGLVFASDSRTNAGVDYISCYSKMHVLAPAPDRLFVLMAAGNLGTTQAVLNRIRRDIENHGAGPSPQWSRQDDPPAGPSMLTARYLFEVADYIGRLNVMVQKEFNPNLRQAGASGEASFILGGQIAGQPHGLYMVYPQGNAIMATADTPFLQIGETKYGKPPLDYIGRPDLSLEDAARLCLVSEIVTRRSNLTVGPPFEIALVRRDEFKVGRHLKFDKEAPEIQNTMDVWARHMQEGLNKLPRFPWEQDPL